MLDADPNAPQARAFSEAILAGDRARAAAIARTVLGSDPAPNVSTLYEAVIRPALEHVGRLWEAGEISVCEEHAGTEIARSIVAALFPDIPRPLDGPRAIVACVPGEQHSLGSRMVADLLMLDGWNAWSLGADTPASELARWLRKEPPRLVALSVSMRENLEPARAAVALVRGAVPEVKVIAGGRALDGVDDAASWLGADVVATTAADAVRIARAWKTR